nr:ATP synthase F0 subunit 8 [Basilia ansifera]
MPQMFPMNWMFMYMFMIMIFMLFLLKNYFLFFPKIPKFTKINNKNISNLNWKW